MAGNSKTVSDRKNFNLGMDLIEGCVCGGGGGERGR